MGLLLACFEVCKDHQAICLVRTLEVMDNMGEQLLNEFDCPLLSMTNLCYCIPSASICHSVSVVHECTHTCTFTSILVSKQVEHESVELVQKYYQHDWSNNMYCHNIFCMNA